MEYAIHSSTLTEIANVIRKKDGTSANIDPADFANRINLMCMLQEDTESGSIANITDGADRVPLKSWQVTLPASLTGYSSVNVVKTGKNLMPDTNYMTNYFSVADNGIVSQKTTGASYAWSYANCIFKTTLPAGTYTAIEELVTEVTNASHGVQVFKSSDDRITTVSSGVKTAGTYSSTFTLSEKTDIGIICKLYDGTAKLYIVSGSSPTTYEPYNVTTNIASLGRTIYGGSVDVVQGTGTENYVRIDLGSLTWSNNASYANVFNGALPTGYVGDTTTDFICEDYANANSTTVINEDMSIAFNYGRTVLYCHDNRFSDWSDFKQAVQGKYIVYKCTAKATDFTFTPITPTPETALGVNNFWANEGNSEITYRKHY